MTATPPEAAEQQVQEDLVRLDAYRNQLNAMLQQHQYLLTSRLDHQRARDALEGLDRTSDEGGVLIPLGGETFVRGVADVKSPVLIGIGSGIVIDVDRGKATEMIAERMKRIDEAVGELQGQVQTLEARIEALSQRIEAASRGGRAEESETPLDDVGRD